MPPPAELEPQRHRAELEVAAQRVQQVAAVAFRELVGTVAEHDEARRSRLYLGDVAKLDPLASGCGRRVGLDRTLEPAVELARRHPSAPPLADAEGGAQRRA